MTNITIESLKQELKEYRDLQRKLFEIMDDIFIDQLKEKYLIETKTYIPHDPTVKEHVPFWDSYGMHCKHPNCELNKVHDHRLEEYMARKNKKD